MFRSTFSRSRPAPDQLRRHPLQPVTRTLTALLVAASLMLAAGAADAQTEYDTRLAEAIEVMGHFTADDANAIPTELLNRAHGIAVIPGVIRGGFLIGGRRGRGVLTVRRADGTWSNPAMITLTGGSIGGQIGIESADVVLVFANQRSIRDIEDGKFTLGGDASAVAGPIGRQNTVALTGRAEVYAYVNSRGLYAGAAFEGARLDVDEEGSEEFYRDSAGGRALPFGEQNEATPGSARRFLRALERAGAMPAPRRAEPRPEPEEAKIFPLGGE